MHATYDLALSNDAQKASVDKENVGFVATFSTLAVEIVCKGSEIRALRQYEVADSLTILD